MPRKQKFQAVALSVRIPDDKERDYSSLLTAILSQRKSVEVFRGTGMALTSFNPKSGNGTISKFSIIDLEGEWFDESGFGPANEKDIEKNSIPANLRPNLISKPIRLNSEDHIIIVMNYSAGKSVSPTQVEKYFRAILSLPPIMEEFGAVQIDLYKDSDEIDEMLKIETLKEIKITVSRPNHFDKDLAKEIEEAHKDEKADEITRTIKTKDNEYLEPGARTLAFGYLAAENGNVAVQYDDAGATVASTSQSRPLIKTEMTDDPESTEEGIFAKISRFLIDAVRANRRNFLSS